MSGHSNTAATVDLGTLLMLPARREEAAAHVHMCNGYGVNLIMIELRIAMGENVAVAATIFEGQWWGIPKNLEIKCS